MIMQQQLLFQFHNSVNHIKNQFQANFMITYFQFIFHQCYNLYCIIMFTINELIHAFDNNINYAWELLYSEILIDHCQINTQHLRTLITLYSKGVERFNNFHPTCSQYFKHKINNLMGQKKVMQCLNQENEEVRLKKINKIQNKNNKENEQSHVKIRTTLVKMQNKLQDRKRQIEMRVAYDMQENKMSKISVLLNEQKNKQERLTLMVNKCMSSEQQKLRNKILQRKERTSFPLNRMDKSLTTEISTISMGQGKDDENNDSVLDDISFISSIVSQENT